MPDERSRDRPGLLLFDCDGTLMNSHHHIIRVMQLAFSEIGLQPASREQISEVIGMSLSAAVRYLLSDTDMALAVALADAYRRLYRELPGDYDLYPGVHETLQVLCGRGYWLGIVTGKSHAGLTGTLDRFGLAHYFMVLRTADHCPSKPHPAMVNECMAEMGVGGAQTAVIGDSTLDMQMACASGAMAVGVCFGVSDAATLRQAGAQHVVRHFPELLAHFPHLQH
jgi:phosphoglycolate phosphatase